jgi:hypothetical protein
MINDFINNKLNFLLMCFDSFRIPAMGPGFVVEPYRYLARGTAEIINSRQLLPSAASSVLYSNTCLFSGSLHKGDWYEISTEALRGDGRCWRVVFVWQSFNCCFGAKSKDASSCYG